MRMGEPMVSVVMGVYNCQATLVEAVESIFAQTYTNWELVICDDASTDGTSIVLNQLMESTHASRITVLRNATNRKLAYSLNRCLKVAKGEYIARMDADDISPPNRIQSQLQYLFDNPRVDLVGTAMRRFNSEGLGEVIHPSEVTPDGFSFARSSRVPFLHATILARREVFDAVNNYTVSWRTERGQDIDLWFKFFAAGLTGRNLEEPLYLVREDAAAVRRRTARARLGGYVTFVRGAWTMGYPPHAYVRATVTLLKILVPYRVFDWHRAWTRRQVLRRSKTVGQAP